jgi:hypothetical protein
MAGLGFCGIIRRLRGRAKLVLRPLAAATLAFLGSLVSGKIDDLGVEVGRNLFQLGAADAGLVDAQIHAVRGHDGEARADRAPVDVASMTYE